MDEDEINKKAAMVTVGVLIIMTLVILAICFPVEEKKLPTCLEYKEVTHTKMGESVNLPAYFLTGSLAVGMFTADRTITTSTSTQCVKWSN